MSRRESHRPDDRPSAQRQQAASAPESYHTGTMKPLILTVDDDPEVLNAIERDLRHHFRADYRVVKAPSGEQALDAVRQLRERGAHVALFLVDERMPHMSGTQFLVEA